MYGPIGHGFGLLAGVLGAIVGAIGTFILLAVVIVLIVLLVLAIVPPNILILRRRDANNPDNHQGHDSRSAYPSRSSGR